MESWTKITFEQKYWQDGCNLFLSSINDVKSRTLAFSENHVKFLHCKMDTYAWCGMISISITTYLHYMPPKKNMEYVSPLSMTFRRNSNCVSTFFLLFEKKKLYPLARITSKESCELYKRLTAKNSHPDSWMNKRKCGTNGLLGPHHLFHNFVSANSITECLWHCISKNEICSIRLYYIGTYIPILFAKIMLHRYAFSTCNDASNCTQNNYYPVSTTRELHSHIAFFFLTMMKWPKQHTFIQRQAGPKYFCELY